jgi:hypothetical protein
MNYLEDIEQEFKTYLNEEKNLNKQDRLKMLMAIANKYHGLEKSEFILQKSDLDEIASYAKHEFPKMSCPVYISGREIYPDEIKLILIVESVVSFLNKHKLLKRLAKFNFTK